jgi:hypothetical protein
MLKGREKNKKKRREERIKVNGKSIESTKNNSNSYTVIEAQEKGKNSKKRSNMNICKVTYFLTKREMWVYLFNNNKKNAK